MRARVALLCVASLLAALLAGAQSPARGVGVEPPAKIYGMEVETRAGTQRLLVFADRPLSHRIEEPDDDHLIVVLPRAALDPSMPRRVRPGRGGAITQATARELRGSDAPEVQIEVRRSRGAEVAVEQRGSTLAVVFEGGAPSSTLSLNW